MKAIGVELGRLCIAAVYLALVLLQWPLRKASDILDGPIDRLQDRLDERRQP